MSFISVVERLDIPRIKGIHEKMFQQKLKIPLLELCTRFTSTVVIL